MPFTAQPDLGSDANGLAHLAARHCRLPHPATVATLDGAIFPTIRHQQRRGEIDHEAGLLLDDNVTPRWALFWTHGLMQTHHPKGWTIAHVWPLPKDPDSYTHLANLCLMPECVASLSDKDGPLCAYLRFHAQEVYGWTPPKTEPLTNAPPNFHDIEWSYLPKIDNPRAALHARIAELGNQRIKVLRGLMGIKGTKD